MSRSLDHHTSRSSMIPNLPLWWSNNSIKCSTYKPCHVSMSFCVGCGMVGNANGVPTTTWRSTWFLGKMGHHHCPQGTIAGKPNLKRKKSDSHWMKREHAAHHTQTKRTKYNNVVHLPVAPKSTRPTPLHVWICLIFIEYVTGHQGIPVLQGIFDKTFFGNVHSSNVGVCNCCRFKTTRYQSDRCVLGHQCFKGVFVGRVWVANHFGQDTKIWWIVQRRRKTKRELLQFFTGKQDRPTHAEYAMGVDGQEHFGGGGFFGQILFVRQGTISKIHGGTFGHEGTKRRGVWPWHDVTGGDGRCHQQGSWLVVEVEQAQHEDGREEWK